MTGHDLRDRLRDVPLPDERGAEERARRVVEAAFAERAAAPERRRPRRPLAALAAAAVVAIAAVVGLAPPRQAVGEWVRHIVDPKPPAPPARVRPVLGPLPGHGRLLVTGRSGTWIVQADGTRRRLGAYDDATFSPRGLFVAAARGPLLAAVDPVGRVRWTLTRPAAVTLPSWSPDGFRVAYRAGRELRVVYGDGALDRRLAARSAAVRPAWAPGAWHRLAAVGPNGRTVILRDADTSRVLWRASARGRVTALAWSPDGRRLLVLTPRAARLLSPAGRLRRSVRAPARTPLRAAAWLPGGRGLAVVRGDAAGTRSRLVVGGRVRLAVPTRLTGVAPSPDGRWLLLTAPDAGQWLLVRTSGPGHLTALSRVGRQFDPGGRGPAALPRIDGWIP